MLIISNENVAAGAGATLLEVLQELLLLDASVKAELQQVSNWSPHSTL